MSFKYWQSALDARLHSLGETLSTDGQAPPRLTRMQLELEARAMRSMLSQVHASMNRLSPVHGLPNVALQRIFLILSHHEPVPNPTWTTRARESSHWTKVLYTCHKFRQAALDCPELWSSPPLGLGSARFYAFIGRSKDVPLTLHLEDDGDVPLTLLHDLVQEPEDLEKIMDLSSAKPLNEGTLKALTGTMDILEILRIQPASMSNDEEGEPTAMVLPENLLNGHAPVLHTLALRGFSTFFNQTTILSHIVSLDISRGVNEKAYTRPSWSDVFSLLGNLPCARTLTLHGCLPLPPKEPTAKSATQRLMIEGQGQAVIDLRHVTDLDISGKLGSVATLFEKVLLLPTCRVHLKFEFSQDGTRKTGQLTEALKRSGFLPPPNAPHNFFHSARILNWHYDETSTRLQIATWLEDSASGATRDIARLVEPWTFVLEFDNFEKGATLDVVVGLRLPLSALRTLFLGADVFAFSRVPPDMISGPVIAKTTTTSSRGEQSSDTPSARDFFIQCTQLRTLYTEGLTGKQLIRTLMHHEAYPALQRLVIMRGLDFESDYKEVLMITWKVLQRTLVARKAKGVPLHFIALHPKTLEEAYWVDKLAETGVTFEAADIATENAEHEDPRWSGIISAAKKTAVPREY